MNQIGWVLNFTHILLSPIGFNLKNKNKRNNNNNHNINKNNKILFRTPYFSFRTQKFRTSYFNSKMSRKVDNLALGLIRTTVIVRCVPENGEKGGLIYFSLLCESFASHLHSCLHFLPREKAISGACLFDSLSLSVFLSLLFAFFCLTLSHSTFLFVTRSLFLFLCLHISISTSLHLFFSFLLTLCFPRCFPFISLSKTAQEPGKPNKTVFSDMQSVFALCHCAYKLSAVKRGRKNYVLVKNNSLLKKP